MQTLEQELEHEARPTGLTAADERLNPVGSESRGRESQLPIIYNVIGIVRTNRRLKIALVVLVNLILIYVLQFHLFRMVSHEFLH